MSGGDRDIDVTIKVDENIIYKEERIESDNFQFNTTVSISIQQRKELVCLYIFKCEKEETYVFEKKIRTFVCQRCICFIDQKFRLLKKYITDFTVEFCNSNELMWFLSNFRKLRCFSFKRIIVVLVLKKETRWVLFAIFIVQTLVDE